MSVSQSPESSPASRTEKLLAIEFALSYPQFELKISEQLPGRGVTAVYGASGSGKTTLLRCIAGLHHAQNGCCTIGEKVWQDASTFVPVHKRALGYVFQQANLFDHMSVEQNLRFGFNRIHPEQRNVAYNDATALLGLEGLLERRPAELSGGQQQRVAIARALLTSPELLLMDEPLTNLDAESKQAIIPYLEHLHDALDIPVIYVSHSLDEILRIADHMLYIENGKVLANGAINDVLRRSDLPLAYLDETAIVLQGKIKAHFEQDHLSEVTTPVGQFYINKVNAMVGETVRIRVAARDVSIALSPATDSSIQHIFPARIADISQSPNPAKQLVSLAINEETLLASITARSVDKLKLHTDQEVYAQVKSVALMSAAT